MKIVAEIISPLGHLPNRSPLHIRLYAPDQLDFYIDFLEEVALWLDERGIFQWRPGDFRRARPFFGASLGRGEVWLAYVDGEAVGTLRLLLQEALVWPEIVQGEGLYLFTLAVRRSRAGQGIGEALLAWAED
ncbi:MAG: GNAT family N-acetyltransferase [Caldilineaceae bacterium]|nr:GNAT family N-acetyltransferase [Caldilineaceae bacterium]